jgi:serine protease Do
VVVSNDGYILTNSHVVEGADDVKVSIGESVRRYDAKVVGTDSLADIAVLKIDAENLSPATLGDSDKLLVGDGVFAIGNPFGVGLSVSRGIVSALSRGNLGIEQIEDFIQTDAAINMGNSGGALIDSSGRVVGINTAILSRTGGFAGIGFAIPINLVRNVAEQIVNTGRVERGYLGVYPQALSPELATQFNTQAGALVAEVTPGSAAEKAGLKAGDIITKVNDLEIRDPRQLLLTVSQLAPGTSVSIQYLREGDSRTATATLGQRPEDSLAGSEGERGSRDDDGVLDGVGVSDITPDVRDQMSIPPRIQGAIVTQVDPASASARQGLRPGDVILELDRRPVRNAEEAVRLSEEIKGPRVLVRIWREGRSLFVVVDESAEQ